MVKMCLCSKVLQNMELFDAMRVTAEIGYRAAEIFGIKKHLPPDTAVQRTEELGRLLGDLGIEVASLCAYVGNFDTLDDAGCSKQMDDFKKHVEQAVVLDARWIRVNPTYLGYKRVATESEVRRFAEWAARCADIAAEARRGICLENNLSMIGTVRGTAAVLKHIGRENVAVSYDPGNIIRMDRENYGPRAIKTFGKRIAILQVKQVRMDLANLEDASVFVYYDEGDVDYSAIYRAVAGLESLKYISVECHKPAGTGMTERDVAVREYALIREHAEPYFEDIC